jgi:hypothetical protein
MNFDNLNHLNLDNIYYGIYFYAIPLLLLFLLIIAIFLLVKNYNLLDLYLSRKKKYEEKIFDNFLKKINKEKKELVEDCIKGYIDLSQEINNTAKNSFKAFKNQEIRYKEEIKELEKEIIKYRKICKSKIKKIDRLEKEINNLKISKG